MEAIVLGCPCSMKMTNQFLQELINKATNGHGELAMGYEYVSPRVLRCMTSLSDGATATPVVS